MLLSFLIIMKYLITYQIISFGNKHKDQDLFLVIISITMMFVMPIVSFYSNSRGYVHIYLGGISPNQWHNSTLILAMPFYLLLFDYSIRKIYTNNVNFIIILILIAVSILAKPNFVLAFIPCLVTYTILLSIKSSEKKCSITKAIIIILVSSLLLMFQYYYTYINNDTFIHPSKTIFAPFLVWNLYSTHIWLSCLLSFAFPLAVTVIYFNQIKKDIYVNIAWGTVLIATLMVAVLAEWPNYSAGNYFWGAIAANFILFIYCTRFLIAQKLCFKKIFCYCILVLHLVSGVLLLLLFFYKGNTLIF
ncbi:hypothetical protein [Francisella philomiragia]|uniref:hypothetical protein n=1 Tax=Francisella philomiragia TaxID=28110 RepID=UPI001B8B7B2D|nr:hypothetical protein [Francisella philomiragia]QUE30952.1 hypothetical protein IMS64_06925 [Francisella philomiragia]